MSEDVYFVVIAFEMTEQIEQWICIKFCVKLEHSSTELFGWFRRLQLLHDSGPTHASCLEQSFLVKHQITQVTQSPYSPDLGPVNFWLFPKLNHFRKGRDLRPSMKFRKIWWGSRWRLGELCGVPRYLLWRGLKHHCPMYNVSCSFLKNSLFFILHGWIPSGQTCMSSS